MRYDLIYRIDVFRRAFSILALNGSLDFYVIKIVCKYINVRSLRIGEHKRCAVRIVAVLKRFEKVGIILEFGFLRCKSLLFGNVLLQDDLIIGGFEV